MDVGSTKGDVIEAIDALKARGKPSAAHHLFADMLQAIRGAHKSITFEMYIYWRGTIGVTFRFGG